MNHIWDRLGISASVICIIHCLLTPALVAISPVLANYFSDQMFHAIVVIIVVPVAVLALWRGYLLHRKKSVLYNGSIGIALIFAALYMGHGHHMETSLMIIAGIILSMAHYRNLKGCQLPHS